MPRVIVKCRYYKNASSSGLGNLMKYIAIRDGTEMIPQEKKMLPETEKQQQFILEITTRNPSLKSRLEYKAYEKQKNRGNASELIAAAVENNPNLLSTEEYLKYMATRPNVEKSGRTHGLFSSEDTVDLEDEIKKLEAHTGNVYSVIVSINREDALRLSYDNATRWRDMVRANICEIASEHGIDVTSLKWYGAFHNESHHPHIHLLLYSTDENCQPYLTKKRIDNLRKLFGTEIFIDELNEIYDKQTDIRNHLTEKTRDEFRSLVNRISSGNCFDESILSKIEQLARRLNSCSGKMQYGYLPKGIKAMVDEIVDEIGQTGDTSTLYDLWYQAKCSVYATYSDIPPEKHPLSREKELKAIRNALVYEAAKLGEELVSENNQTLAKPVQTQPSGSQQSTGKSLNKAASGSASKPIVAGAAMRFAASLARTFYDSYKRYDSDEDDIDRKLRREIRAVKNGENMTM